MKIAHGWREGVDFMSSCIFASWISMQPAFTIAKILLGTEIFLRSQIDELTGASRVIAVYFHEKIRFQRLRVRLGRSILADRSCIHCFANSSVLTGFFSV